MKFLRRFIDSIKAIREFQVALYRGTPLRDGYEVRKISKLLGYDAALGKQLIDGAVPFDPRDTYPVRAAEWARAQKRG